MSVHGWKLIVSKMTLLHQLVTELSVCAATHLNLTFEYDQAMVTVYAN